AIHHVVQRVLRVGRRRDLGEELLGALAAAFAAALDEQPAMLARLPAHGDRLTLEVAETRHLAVAADDQASVHGLAIADGDDEWLQFGVLLPHPGELDTVKDGELKLVVLEVPA